MFHAKQYGYYRLRSKLIAMGLTRLQEYRP
jgi:hypothetical protein